MGFGVLVPSQLGHLPALHGEQHKAPWWKANGPAAPAKKSLAAMFTARGRPNFATNMLQSSTAKSETPAFSYRPPGRKTWIPLLHGDGAMRFCAYNYGGSRVDG